MKGVFLSTGLATNDSANYREAAAPCKPAAKAAVGSQASAVPKVYACRKLFAFARKCRSFVRLFVRASWVTIRRDVPGQNIRQRIGSRSRRVFLYVVFVILSSFARNVSILILILARTGKYQSRTLARSPIS